MKNNENEIGRKLRNQKLNLKTILKLMKNLFFSLLKSYIYNPITRLAYLQNCHYKFPHVHKQSPKVNSQSSQDEVNSSSCVRIGAVRGRVWHARSAGEARSGGAA